ncbi:MFS transporter, partial [Streptomyces sp. NPDC049577]|uniref:MFS transporter n=1 Tax=Streptomyces sp. NPDC049577 TaxID=3155153 RepID=UPI003435C29B
MTRTPRSPVTGVPAPLPTEEAGDRAAPRPVPGIWLAVLAAPVALSANGPALILGDIGDGLDVSVTTVTWMVTAFGWAVAVGTPVAAALLRRRGVRLTLGLSTAAVLTGVLLIALASWFPLVLVARAVLGLGGAGLVTSAMNLAGTVRRMGWITAGSGVFGAVGPLAGKLLDDGLSWRVSLGVQLLCLLALPVVLRRLPEELAGRREGSLDARGAALLFALVTALVGMVRFPGPALGCAAVVAVLLALHVRARPDGFAPAALVRSPVFLAAAGLAFALSTSYFALLYSVPRVLADRVDWSTRAIGVGQMAALLAGSALSWFLAAVAARLRRPVVLTVLLGLGVLAPVAAALTPWAPVLF